MVQQVFTKFDSLEAVDNFLNGENGEPNLLHNDEETRWIKGIIVASLIGKDTSKLIEIYRNQMIGMTDSIIQKFEQMILNL